MRLGLVFLSILNLSNTNLLSELSQQISPKISKNKLGHSHILGKHGSPFYVETRTDVLNFDAGKLQVSIDLGSYVDMEEVHYRWILPEGVALSWGSLDGVITDLSGNNPINLEIEAINLNMETNQNIILFLDRKTTGGPSLGASFVIASRKDLTEEYQKMPDEGSDDDELQLKSMDYEEDISIKKKLIY